MKNIKIILGILVIVTLASVLFYTFRIKATSSNFDFKISVEKDSFILGEEFDILFSIENTGGVIDSVLNFNDTYLSSDADISSDKRPVYPYGGTASGLPNRYYKINPNEKITQIVPLYGFRSDAGSPMYNYFSEGRYKVTGICKNGTGHILKSNILEFEILKPEGIEKAAFEDFSFIVNYQKNFNNRVRNKQDDIILTDKAIEILYKYPTSVYTGKVLDLSFFNRRSGKYKFDESYLKDIEFFVANNPNSGYFRTLLYRITALFSEKLGGKEKAIEYFNTLKQKFNNNKLNKLINEQYQKNELFKNNNIN